MFFQFITIFPEMFAALTDFGVTGRALKSGLWRFSAVNPRRFADNELGYIDDRPFGGGPGMIMQAPPLQAALDCARKEAPNAPVIYLSPRGLPLTHAKVLELAKNDALILLCGRYEGIDERLLRANAVEEIAVGDFVVSGGELPAMMLTDALLRQRPGVLGDERSAREDSFCDDLLDCPHYTRPVEFAGMKVPQVLLSGNHAEIAKWRLTQSLRCTRARRPDLWARRRLSPEELRLLDQSEATQQSISEQEENS